MARLIWTEESRRGPRDVHQYIAHDSPEAAHKVVRGIFDRAHLLLEFPEMGHLYQRVVGASPFGRRPQRISVFWT